jgi:hypothetical protein
MIICTQHKHAQSQKIWMKSYNSQVSSVGGTPKQLALPQKQGSSFSLIPDLP